MLDSGGYVPGGGACVAVTGGYVADCGGQASRVGLLCAGAVVEADVTMKWVAEVRGAGMTFATSTD